MKNYRFILISVMTFIMGTGVFAQTQVYYFSPGTDSPKKAIVVPFSVNDSRYIKSWHFTVLNAQGQQVRRIGEEIPDIEVRPDNWLEIIKAFFRPKKSVTPPSRVVWDGNNDSGVKCPDGNYSFYFDATDDNNNYGETHRYNVVLDTTPPSIVIKQPSEAEKNFGQQSKPTLTIAQSGSREDLWHSEIVNEAGKVVRSFDWRDASPAAFVWNGTDNAGISLPDGVYTYSVSAVDLAGNKSPPAGVFNINYDSTPKDAEAGRALAEFAPQGKSKTQTFTLKASDSGKIESWSFKVQPAGKGGETVFSRPRGSEKFPSNGQLQFSWDGKMPNENVIAQGNFIGKLEVKYANGASLNAETQPFICGGPPLAVVTTTPEHFSPDGDGSNDTLTIKLDVQRQIPVARWEFVIFDPVSSGKIFWSANGKSEIPAQLTWNGRSQDGKEEVESAMDYPYSFTVIDTQEQSVKVDGSIAVDILVRKDGNRLIIRVPAINFRENKADFDKGLPRLVIEKNIRVLNRVAAALQRYPDYRVTVEGHANNVTGTEAEEKRDNLGPLSQSRANVVRDYLINQGVKNKLDAEGIGGKRPVVDRKDSANRWKNRRVEFILQK